MAYPDIWTRMVTIGRILRIIGRNLEKLLLFSFLKADLPTQEDISPLNIGR